MVGSSEGPYAFRRRLDIVHRPGRSDPETEPSSDEIAIGEGWRIVVSRHASPLILNVAKDLQDYLMVSMGVSVLLQPVGDIAAATEDAHVIVLATRAELMELGTDLTVPRGYRVICTAERLIICGFDDRGAGQGSYYLEDLMNLREAPFIQLQDVIRSPLFSPRMTHSGWGLDEFPDTYLNAIAHAGMDSILVFVTGVDRTPDEHTHDHHSTTGKRGGRYQDFNNLVDRAERFGLDVYFYAYFRNLDVPHPSAPDADRRYEETYGEVFQACPRAKGLILVGESVEFPSKDPRTTGRFRQEPSANGLPPTKPSPGWWPCTDYPEWLNLVKTVVRRHNPDADVVFWTYNWGYAPEEDRLALIRSLPSDITLQVTFEMFEPFTRDGVVHRCVDYTASFAGPGRYFMSEAQAAHERGLPLYTMSNTGGLTWDLGVIPYEPVPYQWARRLEALRDAREAWGLRGLMECHHYGWWPSIVSDLAKWNDWTAAPPSDEDIRRLAARDFGAEAARDVLAAWEDWSTAIRDYVPTREDQYGPFRIGPSYPLVFREMPIFPIASHAMFGQRIIHFDYATGLGGKGVQTAGPVRVGAEILSLQRMAERWQRGIQHMESAVEQTPERKRPDAERQLGIARFFLNAIRTTIHTKEWWRLKHEVWGEPDAKRATALLDAMHALAGRELANVEATIPVVEADSRLGWEPSMDYVCDADHLRWKMEQVRYVVDHELPAYRRALDVSLETAR